MNPLSIALAFIVFWLVIGLGLFLFFNTLAALLKHARAGVELGLLAPARVRHSLALVLDTGLLLLGMAMVAAGGYATYVVVYR